MVTYRGCHVTLTIVCTVFIMVTIATFDQQRQPLGPEMCKHHCGQFSECTFCIFLIERLACIASRAKNPPQTNGEEAIFLNFTKERLASISQRKDLCKGRQSRIILTRSSGFRCKKLRTDENTRLLVAPFTNRSRTPLYAFHLLNSSITTYHHIKLRLVSAMAYVATLRQVVVAIYRPTNIHAFSLHTNFSATIRRKDYALAIAVDDAQQLVFLATRSPHWCVTRMTPDGRYFKNVTCQIIAYALCLDTRREIVYVGGPKSIYSFKYDGHGRQLITTSHRVRGLTLGENGDVMYYSDNSNIMAVELFKNGTGRKITGSYFKLFRILYSNGNLYISSMGNESVHVWHELQYSRLRGANPNCLSKQLIALMPESA